MSDILNTQLNVSEETIHKESYSTNRELVHRENIPGTPFTIITIPGEGQQAYKWDGREEKEVETDGDVSFGTLGKYRITVNRRSISEVRDELTDFSWDVVMKLLAVIIPNEVERILGKYRREEDIQTEQ